MIEKVVNHITENIANSVEKKLEVNNNMKKNVREAEKSPTGIKTEDIKIDLQQLKTIEKLILAFMGDMKWEIKQLETQLTVEKSCSSIGKGQLTNCLKNRPHLFAITDIYVHSYLKEKGIQVRPLNFPPPPMVFVTLRLKESEQSENVEFEETLKY